MKTVQKTPVALPQHASVEGTSLDHVLRGRCFRPYLGAGLGGSCSGCQQSLLEQYIRQGTKCPAATLGQAICAAGSDPDQLSCGGQWLVFRTHGRLRLEVLQAVSLGLSHGTVLSQEPLAQGKDEAWEEGLVQQLQVLNWACLFGELVGAGPRAPPGCSGSP